MIQPHWSTPPKSSLSNSFPETELPVQQWAGEAHGFWLQTDEEWPHSCCEKHATLRQSLDWNPTPVPPCWTRSKHICNSTLWDMFLDCTILLQDISWVFGLWYIIWLKKKAKLAIISLLTTKASVCNLSILKKHHQGTQRRMPQSSKDLQVPVALEPGKANCRDFCRKSEFVEFTYFICLKEWVLKWIWRWILRFVTFD